MNEQEHGAENPAITQSEVKETVQNINEYDQCNKTYGATASQDENVLRLHAALKNLPEELQLNVIAEILQNFIDKPKFFEKLRIIVRESQNPDSFGAKNYFSQLDLQNALAEIEELKRTNKMLEDDINNVRDINVKLRICSQVNNLKAELNTKVIEVKELQDLQKKELNYFYQEQQKLLDIISVLKKENKNVLNSKETYEKSIDIVKMLEDIKYYEEALKEIASLNLSNESFRYSNTSLLAQLDHYEKKTKKALKCLLDERINLGNFIINTATDKTLELMKQTLNCGCRNELNNTCKIQRQYLDYLVSIHTDFSEKIYKCSLSLKTNEDEFKIEDIPPLPAVPPIPECKPVEIPYSSLTSNNNTANMQAQLHTMMTQPKPQLPNRIIEESNYVSPSNKITDPQMRSVSEPPGLCPSPTRKSDDKLAQTLDNFIQNDKVQKNIGMRKCKSVLKDMSSVNKDPNNEQTIESKTKMWKVNNSLDGNFSSDHCSICMESLSKSTTFKAECGHNYFHEKCVVPWLRVNSSCPVCRKYLLLPDEFPKL